MGRRRWHVICGDSLTILRGESANTVDAIITDPPAGIGFMGKNWDRSRGGMNPWIDWLSSVMLEALRVSKPGAHALVWALPRTSHWTGLALERAGWEVRDVVTHLFGTGFPKSLNLAQEIEKARRGAERGKSDPESPNHGKWTPVKDRHNNGSLRFGPNGTNAVNEPNKFVGQGTALKPAAEFWFLARKPVEGTIRANAEKWGTGGLRIDDCRIGNEKAGWGGGGRGKKDDTTWSVSSGSCGLRDGEPRPTIGRWPANLILSGDGILGDEARYFYQPKPSRKERDEGLDGPPQRSAGEVTGRVDGSAGSKHGRSGRTASGMRNVHPTVKSIALMRYLVRLITPKGGLVLDPFMGSGSTGCAAVLEDLRFVGIDENADYVDIAERRIAHWEANHGT